MTNVPVAHLERPCIRRWLRCPLLEMAVLFPRRVASPQRRIDALGA